MTRTWRVIVADDEQDIRDFFQKILVRLGYQVVGVAKNGQELVDLFDASHPDLVITDICMPVLSGLDAVRSILAKRKVPVILISAQGESFPERADLDHLVCHLGKPVKREILSRAILKILEQVEDSPKPWLDGENQKNFSQSPPPPANPSPSDLPEN